MNAQKSHEQHRKMTEENIRKLILRLATPSTVAMVVTALYSLADALFVSKLGTGAGAAVGVSFAIQALIQAVGYTLGTGAGSLLSRNLGKKRTEDANTYAKVAFWLSLLSGAVIMAVGLLFGGKLIRFLGATDSIYPFALDYARYLLLSAPFMCSTFVLSLLLRAEGKAVYSMVGLACGSLLNIALDPLLIYRFHMGIGGASLATLISQIVSFAVLLSAYLLRSSQITLFKKPHLKDFATTGKIIVSGLPSSGRQGLMALATVLLNRKAALWGDAAVAALAVVNRLFLLAFSICLGIGQGMMPVAGYNYGFNQTGRVRQAYQLSLVLSTVLMLLISIPMFAFAPQLIALFRNDPQVISIGTLALRAQSAVLLLHGCITCTNMLLQALGKSFSATLLACARQGLFFLPLIWFLPTKFGIESVLYIQPLSDALTFLFTIPFLISQIYKLKEKAVLQ